MGTISQDSALLIQAAGGLNNESILDGILLALEASVSVSPGGIVGEIISGGNINIASGAGVKVLLRLCPTAVLPCYC